MVLCCQHPVKQGAKLQNNGIPSLINPKPTLDGLVLLQTSSTAYPREAREGISVRPQTCASVRYGEAQAKRELYTGRKKAAEVLVTGTSDVAKRNWISQE